MNGGQRRGSGQGPYGGAGNPYGGYGGPFGGPYWGPYWPPTPPYPGWAAPWGFAAGPAGPPPGYGFPYGPEAELEFLRGQAEYLEDLLDGIRKRIQELESQTTQQ